MSVQSEEQKKSGAFKKGGGSSFKISNGKYTGGYSEKCGKRRRENLPYYIRSVSYTHLDVYKRQVHTMLEIVCWF